MKRIVLLLDDEEEAAESWKFMETSEAGHEYHIHHVQEP